MLECERKYVARQDNYNRVPHPLMEGLVCAGFFAASPEQAMRQAEHFEWMEVENDAVRELELN